MRYTTSGCKEYGFKESELVLRTQFLYQNGKAFYSLGKGI